ncbi:MAG: hypothetical protein SF069_17675 [Phycisphaerae bacterium]|nr:hypothetical protein [Phycisphaerae bacterium]
MDFWVELSIAQILKLYAGHGVGAIVRNALADYLAADCPDLPQFKMRGGRFCPSVGRVKCVAAIDEMQLRSAELLAVNRRTQFAGENQLHALLRRALAWFIAQQMSPEYADRSATNVYLEIDGMEAVANGTALDAPPPAQAGGSLN